MEVTTPEPSLTVQIRAVRKKYLPIMMTPTRLFGTRSITHHVIVVGDPRTKPGIVTFELANLEKEVGYEITRSPAATVDPGNRVIGFTRKSDEEIELYAATWIKENPQYHLTKSNCKHFAKALALYIIDPTLVEPEYGARYRFTQYHLRATSTVQFSGPQTGWILPSAEKILVNVTQMQDDQDIWEGEVEGDGEHGMFLSYTVERVE